jgi:hypothetical protein
MDTTIVVSYRPGTADLLRVCLSAVARHTSQDVKVLVISTDISDQGLMDYEREQPFKEFESHEVSVGDVSVNWIHGTMLDAVIPEYIDTEYFLTLDSDCFPVADDWLDKLKRMLKTCKIAGIRQPWAPPPEDIDKKSLAYRIRSQQCFDHTHVACQMMRTEDYKQLQTAGAKYAAGDDTGLLVNKIAVEQGFDVLGFDPVRCPKGESIDDGMDPEFNRAWCVVYGDCVCHIGAYTRGQLGQPRPESADFEWAVKRIIADGGAEFLLEDRLSYKYLFDREEEVAAEKMQRLLGMKDQRMDG